MALKKVTWLPLTKRATAAPAAVSPQVMRVPSSAWVTGERSGSISCAHLRLGAVMVGTPNAHLNVLVHLFWACRLTSGGGERRLLD